MSAADSRIQLGYNRYGKSHVRLLKVTRHNELHHSLSELKVQLLLEGDFADSYILADNSKVVPTDTCKNSIYALAKLHDVSQIESFALVIARHMTKKYSQVTGCQVVIEETKWDRVCGDTHKHAFTRNTNGTRFCRLAVAGNGSDVRLVSGLKGLTLLKSTMSKFVGFDRTDPWTSLPPVEDRLMRTTLFMEYTWANARAYYDEEKALPNFSEVARQMEEIAINEFSGDPVQGTMSASVQQNLYQMGEIALKRFSDLETVFTSLPNLHCWEYDMSKVKMENNGEIYYPTDEPFGLIEAFITRKPSHLHRESLIARL